MLGLAALSCGGLAESSSTSGPAFQEPRSSARPSPAAPSRPEVGLLPPSSLPEETCADNPLLAKCATSSPAQPRFAAPSQPATPDNPSVVLEPGLTPVERAEAVLGARCGGCHGPAINCGVCDGLHDIDDLGKMIEVGRIAPCRWTESRIYQRIARGEMPPTTSGVAPPTASDLRVVSDTVNGLCDDLTSGGPVTSGRTAIESWLAEDCGSCHGNTPAADAGTASRLPLVDLSELVAEGVIVPCNPGGSLLVQRLTDNSMPPPGSSAERPTSDEIAALTAFIERPCARR